jgi:hypothetical protein
MTVSFGIRRLALLAASVVIALACLGGATKSYAGVAIDDSVKLDPFDPVPQIGFHHDGCDEGCGYHRCHSGCYRHSRCGNECRSWHCCYRDCDRGCRDGWGCEFSCREAREDMERYRHQSETYDALMAIYTEQLCWYDAHYRHRWDAHPGGACRGVGFFDGDGHWHDGHPDGWHDDGHHDGDHRDGDRHDDDHHRDGPPPDGYHDGGPHDGDGHDGDHHHDGQWQDHDGSWHDGPPPDGHRDGDPHDGGGQHDGDGHDGDHHHDGQWQDHDGNWHDGPPPDGYGH